MITAGLFYDVNKPDFHKYLEPIVQEFEKLTIDGVVFNSENFRFIVTHSTVDLPCKSALQCIVQYNGYSACSYCEHPGEKTSVGVRYTVQNSQSNPLRSHSKMISTIQKVLKTGKTINGVKGLSPMVGFQFFDLINSFVIDYMHGEYD